MEPKASLQDGEYVLRPDLSALYECAKRIRQQLADDQCPYCSKPEGWDACPVHRDGTPTT